MTLSKYFPKTEHAQAEKILVTFHDRLLLDEKINNNQALALAVYMISNEHQKSMVEKDKVRDLFLRMGRKEDEFRKTLYEISGKRKNGNKSKQAWIDQKDNLLGLNFSGLSQVGIILQNKDN